MYYSPGEEDTAQHTGPHKVCLGNSEQPRAVGSKLVVSRGCSTPGGSRRARLDDSRLAKN